MHKYQLLRQRAEEFRLVLEEYARKDPDVADFLERWMSWYEKIQRREIRLPCYEYKLSIYFTNPDLSPMAIRYHWENLHHPLCLASAKFSAAIRDDLSHQPYLDGLRASGELPDIIPDEPPPPEEEAPLPQPVSQPDATKSRKGWLNRWIFGDEQ
jgi:hypothetical protein